MTRILDLYNSGRLGEVRAEYHRLVQAGEAGAEAHLLGAGAAHGEGDLPAARAAIELALQAGAEGDLMADVEFGAAYICGEAGDWDGAVRHYTAAVAAYAEFRPDSRRHRWALHNLGYTYRLLERWDESMDAYQRSIDLSQEHGDAVTLCKALQDAAWAACLMGDPVEAGKLLDEAEGLLNFPGAKWHQILGRAFQKATEAKTAVTALAMCVDILANREVEPDIRAQALYVAGRARLTLGDITGARSMADHFTEQGNCLGPRYQVDAGRLQELVTAAAG